MGPRSSYSVDLHIDEVVLHGFADDERYRIGEAIERELTRLFAEQGVPPALARSGEIAHLGGGAGEVLLGSTPEATAAELARAIYEGFGQ